MNGDVDPGSKGIVQGPDTIRGKEDNTCVILQGTQKHWQSQTSMGGRSDDLPEAKAFLFNWSRDLASRNTSASSISRTAEDY